MRRRLIVVATALLGFFLATHAFGQDASLSGTVTDASGGVVHNTTVTATNDNTGIVSTVVTNAAGVYSFPRLLFGVYTVKAEQTGFQPKSFTKVTLLSGQQARLNFQLDIAGVAINIEVSTSAERLLLESSSSVGDALSAEVVEDLPLVNRNALDLVKVMSGVVMSDDAIFGANNTTFAGVAASGVNIQRDGVMVNDVRWPTGINAATRVNPDMVGEFRMVLAPVDAEIGRGNAQIQIVTKSGTNEYHGGAVWNVQNTALDPNTWENNRNGVVAPWRNMHQYSGFVGGPIKKNKTFFFVLFDGQLSKIRTEYNALSLTPCARKGIFRYWDRWNNSNALYVPSAASAGAADPLINTVDRSGNALRPAWEPGAANWGVTPYTGQLRYASVFGAISNLDTIAPDCSNAQVTGTWDPVRPVQDPSGYIADFLGRLPEANNFDIGDGLNTAGSRWARTLNGADNLYGVGEDTWRRQINVRIDHNFNDKHRISGTWSWEKDWSDDSFKNWPDGYGGKNIRRPMVIAAGLVSSLGPTLINEFKFGMSRTGTNVQSPITNPEGGDKLKELLAQFGTLPDDQLAIIGPGMGAFNFGPENFSNTSNYFGGRGMLIAPLIDLSPRYSWGDTMSWVKGAHSLRFGGEIRRISSRSQNGWNYQYVNNPYAAGGELVLTPTAFDNAVGDLAGSSSESGNKRALRDLLVFQSGSLSAVRQLRFINKQAATTWNDPVADPLLDRDTIMHEFSLFFKDDWKIRPDLTLNLGLRYDYYGVPFLNNGMTVGLEGGGDAIFGPSGGFDNWFMPIKRGDVAPGELVNLRSIGPDGQYPEERLYPKRWKNFGPAVGFAWQLPWLGKGKTTIRGGYQISYLGMAGNFSTVEANAGQAPGTIYQNSFNNNSTWAAGSYFGIKDLTTNEFFANGVPLPSNVTPGIATFTLYDRRQNMNAFAPDYMYPYIQNLTVAITRNITSNLMMDVRYIGTLTRHNFSTLNVNTPNFLTNGLLDAFDAARRGENPVLLDQLLNGMAPLPWGCTVNGDTCKGGAALRDAAFPNFTLPWDAAGAFTNLNTMLAMGNYNGLANAINALSNPGGAPGYTQTGEFIETNGFPVNFIKASPQFSNANLSTNQGHSNYHSFQAQLTLRPTKGLSFSSTYTWSRNLGVTGAFNDPRNIAGTYGLLASDRPHNWVTYGTYDLPFGPGRSFGNSTSGALARVIGGWQMGWITTIQSGSPLNLSARCGQYDFNCTPDEVNGGIDHDSVGATWSKGAATGSYLSDRYTYTRDPQCANVDASISFLCTLQAVVDSKSGRIVLQNPAPGTKGNMGIYKFRNLTRWNVDMSMSKSVMINEAMAFRLRADFTNIFNHPVPSGSLGSSGTRIVFPTAPNMDINSSNALGLYNYKVGGRTIQLMVRFDF
jgi:hypothetical protein